MNLYARPLTPPFVRHIIRNVRLESDGELKSNGTKKGLKSRTSQPQPMASSYEKLQDLLDESSRRASLPAPSDADIFTVISDVLGATS